jgi:hypothetical protein
MEEAHAKEGELGFISLFLIFMGAVIITISILTALDIFIPTNDPGLLKLMIFLFGVSLGLTEAAVGWLLAEHPRK